MKTIILDHCEEHLDEAVSAFKSARGVAALTGAGISVKSGIPDFRSPGGLWTRFSPDEYATIEVFRRNPEKAWALYRALGLGLVGKKPNIAHQTLAQLEEDGYLRGIVTQNIDNLHQSAGNRFVFEIHGDHQHLHCIQCGFIKPVEKEHYTMDGVPICDNCSFQLKPNVVLFGEAVRMLDEINFFIQQCDLLMVIGTSAQIYPAAGLPHLVKGSGGKIYEFNKEATLGSGVTDYFFEGDLSKTMPAFGKALGCVIQHDL
jgi:NAD-dependent deacetylase